jgi:uncharacterized membrane protein YgcG
MDSSHDRGRRRRISVAALSVLCAVTVFAALGGIGLANGVIGIAQYQYGKKVTICHKGNTLTISQKAWPAHQRHGDTLGACVTSKHKKNKGKHKGEAHHAPNPSTGSGETTTTTSTTTTTTETSHGNSKGHGNSGGNGNGGGNGKGNGHNK